VPKEKEEKKDGTRLKILLVKQECFDDTLIKESARARSFDNMDLDNGIKLYYREMKYSIPKWYKKFLAQHDEKVKVASGVAAFFFRTIELEKEDGTKEQIKFAICFGGGDAGLNLEKFDDKFGLRIALNLGKSFVNVTKDNISTTQSKTREQAVKPMGMTSFGIDFEKDMVTGVTVIPHANELTEANITGNILLSISTENDLDELDDLLAKCYELSLREDYAKIYPFIKNIVEIDRDKDLIARIDAEVIKAFNAKETDKVWISVPEAIEWTDITGYVIFSGNKEWDCYELDSRNVYAYLENYGTVITSVKDLKRIKVAIETVTGSMQDIEWSLNECLYAQIDLDGNRYVLNNKKYYQIDKNYVESVEKRFNKIDITPALPKSDKHKIEKDYIEDICKDDGNLILMDRKLVTIRTQFEICDILNKEDKTFIHLKKYGASSVLSHLFAQAFNSADLFASAIERADMIAKIREQDATFDGDDNRNNYGVILGIIAKKEPAAGKHLQMPFFSKMNMVATKERIEKLGYKFVKIMYIEMAGEEKEQPLERLRKVKTKTGAAKKVEETDASNSTSDAKSDTIETKPKGETA